MEGIFKSLIRIAVCSVAVALAIRSLSMLWKRILAIDVTPREQTLLMAGVIGLLVGFRFVRDYALAAQVGSIVIGGYFANKWLARVVARKFPSKEA